MYFLNSSPKIVLVTGANQGLGLGVIEVAGIRNPNNTFILGSRDLEKGNLAVKQLHEAGVTAKVEVIQLEVTNNEHITAAVRYVQETYGKLDVLVNNAGHLEWGANEHDLDAVRAMFNRLLSVHVSSVAVMIYAFRSLLYKSAAPKVINVTSGLASMQRALTPGQRMGRAPPYGAAKIGMNGMTVHMQLAENDRVAAEGEGEGEGKGKDVGGPRIRFFIVAPGVLKTAFSHFVSFGKPPQEGAEAIVRLLEDETSQYDGAMQWEYEGGEMREIPW